MRYAFCVLVGLVCVNLCFAKEKERVTISYVLGPPKPLPEGLKAVAVINSGVETRGAKEDKRERKWSTMAADMIEAMLADGSTRFQSGLKVAQRRQTQAILKEQDLKLAGLVEGDAAAKAGKLLDVQGLIVSRITINIDVEKGTKSTLDWGSLMGNMASGASRSNPPPRPAPSVRVYRDPRDPRGQRVLRYQRYYGPQYVAPPPQAAPIGPPGGLQTKEVEEVSRHITVQCSFSLIDAVTGGAIVQYSPPPIQKHDSSSPDFLFGGMMKPEQLDPVDHFIGELVERATQEFVSTIVPTEVEYAYTVVGKGSAGEKGVRLLRAEDYAGAMEQFLAECRKKPDEHETLFALGVASELLGDHAEALEYYRQAAAGDADKEELAMYVSAKKRLSEHLPRIMKPLSDANPKPESSK
jgi:hypothetical protein